MMAALVALLQHAGQEGADGAEHRAHVQRERELPLLLGGVQDGAVMHDAGAVEQDIDRPGLLRRRDDRRGIGRVQPGGFDVVVGKPGQQRLVQIGRDHMRAFGGEGQGGGPPDALAGGGDERGLVGQSGGHSRVPGIVCGRESGRGRARVSTAGGAV
jgi:hypothetical protein